MHHTKKVLLADSQRKEKQDYVGVFEYINYVTYPSHNCSPKIDMALSELGLLYKERPYVRNIIDGEITALPDYITLNQMLVLGGAIIKSLKEDNDALINTGNPEFHKEWCQQANTAFEFMFDNFLDEIFVVILRAAFMHYEMMRNSNLMPVMHRVAKLYSTMIR